MFDLFQKALNLLFWRNRATGKVANDEAWQVDNYVLPIDDNQTGLCADTFS